MLLAQTEDAVIPTVTRIIGHADQAMFESYCEP